MIRVIREGTIHDMLAEMQHHLQHDTNDPKIRAFQVGNTAEHFGVKYVYDDPDADGAYADIGAPSLPTDVYAVIDDGTYGTLEAYRVML